MMFMPFVRKQRVDLGLDWVIVMTFRDEGGVDGEPKGIRWVKARLCLFWVVLGLF